MTDLDGRRSFSVIVSDRSSRMVRCRMIVRRTGTEFCCLTTDRPHSAPVSEIPRGRQCQIEESSPPPSASCDERLDRALEATLLVLLDGVPTPLEAALPPGETLVLNQARSEGD
jgi:hypothetical protein